VVAAAAVVLSATLSGCSTIGGITLGGDAQHTSLVGVALPTTTSDRWIADGKNVTAQLEALGHAVDLEYAENDVPTQVEQISAMIAEGADALIIGAIDGTKLKDVLAKAAAENIPVISYDRLIRDSPDIAYYASFDNAKVGVQQGTTLLQGLGVLDAAGEPTGERGPFAVELFAGSPDDNNATVFYDGAMGVLQPYLDSGVLTVPSGQTDFATIATQAWDGKVAAQRMTTLLDGPAAGVRLDGILSPYDGISRAVLDVLAPLGYGSTVPWPVTTGQDAEAASVKSIMGGQQYSTIYKDTRQLAEVAVSMVDALLQGTEPETNDITSYDNGTGAVPAYLLAPQVVTADRVTAVLVDSGYYTAEELS
jgi:putative multiple sugar transport system substrate-binding protein